MKQETDQKIKNYLVSLASQYNTTDLRNEVFDTLNKFVGCDTNDYFVKCDQYNNPKNIIDNNQLVCEVY